MDNRPIGIFDSGVGGLSAVHTLQTEAPGESIIYFGDTARVPYGNRRREDITRLSRQDARFLCTHDPQAILIACNTITASCIDVLRADHPDIPIVGTIEPAVNAALQRTKNGRIGIIATQATVDSQAYEQALTRRLPEVQIFSQSCPDLVPLIESGHISRGDELIEAAVANYLAPIKVQSPDTVILGCTHYPLIREVVQEYLGPDVSLVDSGRESALALLELLARDGRKADKSACGKSIYFCSAAPQKFEAVAELFLHQNIHNCTTQIDIEAF